MVTSAVFPSLKFPRDNHVLSQGAALCGDLIGIQNSDEQEGQSLKDTSISQAGSLYALDYPLTKREEKMYRELPLFVSTAVSTKRTEHEEGAEVVIEVESCDDSDVDENGFYHVSNIEVPVLDEEEQRIRRAQTFRDVWYVETNVSSFTRAVMLTIHWPQAEPLLYIVGLTSCVSFVTGSVGLFLFSRLLHYARAVGDAEGANIARIKLMQVSGECFAGLSMIVSRCCSLLQYYVYHGAIISSLSYVNDIASTVASVGYSVFSGALIVYASYSLFKHLPLFRRLWRAKFSKSDEGINQGIADLRAAAFLSHDEIKSIAVKEIHHLSQMSTTNTCEESSWHCAREIMEMFQHDGGEAIIRQSFDEARLTYNQEDAFKVLQSVLQAQEAKVRSFKRRVGSGIFDALLAVEGIERTPQSQIEPPISDSRKLTMKKDIVLEAYKSMLISFIMYALIFFIGVTGVVAYALTLPCFSGSIVLVGMIFMICSSIGFLIVDTKYGIDLVREGHPVGRSDKIIFGIMLVLTISFIVVGAIFVSNTVVLIATIVVGVTMVSGKVALFAYLVRRSAQVSHQKKYLTLIRAKRRDNDDKSYLNWHVDGQIATANEVQVHNYLNCPEEVTNVIIHA